MDLYAMRSPIFQIDPNISEIAETTRAPKRTDRATNLCHGTVVQRPPNF
ncbi:hypothetical protein RSc2026 [Ralstonia pseudosolanacearum GMI1000]|uniref:Uncharacterized protein n=2 Tax=Ralstonia solanacearum species complex TaxID=3116862 RepID=A0A0S4ULI9_RALSL|nr:hypothetical protein RSc2026 [Ralstonia pseudosolanacearum GMI1000]CUV23114.1 conserved protein of unknown function [Ralstonia solanacearum]CUV32262.1 conserved protein of unknown function [Ralstonia solanacearum]CUV39775.1 conserved protein of unknown function [Ralstonia solanacearum]CUV44423.1 conserved protein of unknown function [Ralstonia solanacearum]